ncbi:hypothetical protein BKA70DRAFT_839068 [Coprinopsis sp. MPI-PUGE-AT-0042]|nr:hypothetical protein BKA70DRAFT_839068 [Coprinopsis sp. MPI-PUGE-AT-0042]
MGLGRREFLPSVCCSSLLVVTLQPVLPRRSFSLSSSTAIQKSTRTQLRATNAIKFILSVSVDDICSTQSGDHSKSRPREPFPENHGAIFNFPATPQQTTKPTLRQLHPGECEIVHNRASLLRKRFVLYPITTNFWLFEAIDGAPVHTPGYPWSLASPNVNLLTPLRQ